MATIVSSVEGVLEACRQALMFQIDVSHVTQDGAEDHSEEGATVVNKVLNGLATKLQEKVQPAVGSSSTLP